MSGRQKENYRNNSTYYKERFWNNVQIAHISCNARKGYKMDNMTADEQEDIAAKIKHILGIYPCLSPSMLQAALGPQVPASEWRPVLEDMKHNGIIIQDSINLKSPAGRHNDYVRLMLAESYIAAC